MSAEVVVVSDALGETAEVVARAAVSQFHEGTVRMRKFPHIEREESLGPVLEYLSKVDKAVVLYTVVLPHVRERLRTALAEAGVPAVDVLGPVMEALRAVVPEPPKLEAGLVHRLDAEYFRRVAAVEFAVKCDDGKDPRGILLADVVLLGVSRSSKTPLSMYLAHRQILAANIPLVPEVTPPAELTEVDPKKVVGLIVNPETLTRIRQERVRAMGLGPGARYADPVRILEELEYASRTYRRLGCHVIDVTNRAVEETASQVLDLVGKEDRL